MSTIEKNGVPEGSSQPQSPESTSEVVQLTAEEVAQKIEEALRSDRKLPLELNNDPEAVMQFVEKYRRPQVRTILERLGDKLKGNKDFILRLIKQSDSCSRTLLYLDPVLRLDPEVVAEVIKVSDPMGCSPLSFAEGAIRSNKALYLLAIETTQMCPCFLSGMSSSLRSNGEVMLAACKAYGAEKVEKALSEESLEIYEESLRRENQARS